MWDWIEERLIEFAKDRLNDGMKLLEKAGEILTNLITDITQWLEGL